MYTVTTLGDTGAGSLRDAIATAGPGPRTIVFAVGGTIHASDPLPISGKAKLTIAGQTAPGDGILIRGAALQIKNGSSDIMVRHLRVRYGDDTGNERDAISISDSHDVILDHVSASWGEDETLSVTGDVTNVTVQNSIIAEGLKDTHQYGSLVNSETAGGGRITFWRNLYVNQLGRTPRAASQNGEPMVFELVNNVVYNWGHMADWGTQATITDNEEANWNMVANVYVAGPSTAGSGCDAAGNHQNTILRGGSGGDSVHFAGNLLDANANGAWDGVAATTTNTQGSITWLASPIAVDPWAQIGAVQPGSAALATVIADAGARPWGRDAADARFITELTSYGTQGSIKESVPVWPTIAGGAAPADADHDGMPDSWEVWYGTDPATPSNNQIGQDGYRRSSSTSNGWSIRATSPRCLEPPRIGGRPRRPCRRSGRGFEPSRAESFERAQRASGGVVAAHAVDAAARGRGGRAKEDARIRCRVGVEARDGASEELEHVGDAAGDGAAHVVRVHALEVEGRGLVASEDALAEAGREALELALDGVGHVDGGARGDVTVGVAGVLSGGRTARVELALLHHDQVGAR